MRPGFSGVQQLHNLFNDADVSMMAEMNQIVTGLDGKSQNRGSNKSNNTNFNRHNQFDMRDSNGSGDKPKFNF